MWEEVDVFSPFFYRMPNVYKLHLGGGLPASVTSALRKVVAVMLYKTRSMDCSLTFFSFSLKITLLKQNEKASEGKFTTWGNRLTARSLLGQGGCVASVAVCGTVRECPSRD